MADLDEVPLVHEEEQAELSLAERLQEGTALCLSGGGYRAMLFHLGALWYLNEQRLLGRIARFSSVSGGSITSAVLGWKWRRLKFDDGGRASNFETEVGAPIRELASVTIDTRAVLGGLLPFDSIGDRLTAFYRDRLFGDATLQDLPEEPRFVINATNLQ
jgi:NTE family protein